jgi:hypothetical protein
MDEMEMLTNLTALDELHELPQPENQAYEFRQLLACLDVDSVPVDLFIRACRGKPSWSSTGNYFYKDPRHASVPAWLHPLFGPKAAFTNDQEPAALSEPHFQGQICFTKEYGVTHVQISREYRLVSYCEITKKHRRDLLLHAIAIVVHAYPCALAELIGDEMQIRLLRIVEDGILPLLAAVTDEDIISWVSPQEK